MFDVYKGEIMCPKCDVPFDIHDVDVCAGIVKSMGEPWNG